MAWHMRVALAHLHIFTRGISRLTHRFVLYLAVCIIDPGSHFMQAWNARFDALEITHLRSPALVHPVALDPAALVCYAIEEGRTDELIEAPVEGHWLVSTDIDREKYLKALPSSALFK